MSHITAKYLKKILVTSANTYEHTLRALRHGILIDPIIKINKDTADALIELYGIDLNNANATFYQTFEEREQLSWDKVLLDRLVHYATTYGGLAPFLGGVYIPHSQEQLTQEFAQTMTKIEVVSPAEMKEALQIFVNQPLALPSEDIKDLAQVVHDYDLETNTIQNKELLIQLALNYDILPENPQLFLRVLLAKALDTTELINNRRTRNRLDNALGDNFKAYAIRELVKKYLKTYGAQALADHYRPYKKLWLIIRKAGLQKEINLIKRLSEKHRVSHETFTIFEKAQNLSVLNNYQLIKLYNYVAEQSILPETYVQLYRIRDGRVYVTDKRRKDRDNIKALQTEIAAELQQRFRHKNLKFYQPDPTIDIKLPTSAKSFLGSYPMYTTVQTKDEYQVGIYWDVNCDLDLHGHHVNGNHCGYYTENIEGCTHTGDMTRLNSNGFAAEAIKSKNVAGVTYSVNRFNAPASTTCSIYLARVFEGNPTKVLENGHLLFHTKMQLIQKEMQFATSIDHGLILTNLALGGHVPNHLQSEKIVEAITRKTETSLNLTTFAKLVGAQFVDTPEEATHDFSQEAISANTFTDLLK